MKVTPLRVLLGAPFVAVAIGAAVAAKWGVPVWGDRIAKRLVAAAALVRPRPRPKLTTTGGKEDAWAIEPTPPPPAETTDPGAPRDRRDAGTPITVRVPARTVQWVIDDRTGRVHARTVRGSDGQPAGVRLTGVSSLAVGLQDGDVVVAIDDVPALDEATATDAALSVVAREREGESPSILRVTAKRGDRPFTILAELPPAPAVDRTPLARKPR